MENFLLATLIVLALLPIPFHFCISSGKGNACRWIKWWATLILIAGVFLQFSFWAAVLIISLIASAAFMTVFILSRSWKVLTKKIFISFGFFLFVGPLNALRYQQLKNLVPWLRVFPRFPPEVSLDIILVQGLPGFIGAGLVGFLVATYTMRKRGAWAESDRKKRLLGVVSMSAFLLAYANWYAAGMIDLYGACENANPAAVKYVLASRPGSVRQRDLALQTPLHISVCSPGAMHITKILVYKGADVNARTVHGNTPLHYAVKHANIAAVKSLIKYGANPNTVNDKGQSPLHLATGGPSPIRDVYIDGESPNEELCRLLISAGADPEIPDQYGRTPYFYFERVLLIYGQDPEQAWKRIIP